MVILFRKILQRRIQLQTKLVLFLFIVIIGIQPLSRAAVPEEDQTMDKISKSSEEWKKILTREQFEVLREKGTERTFTGKYDKHYGQGTYKCAGCGKELFSSESKFESGTGWPSFWKPFDENAVATEQDSSYGMERVEVLCPRCGGHLGHLFEDGPAPTHLRYCINSVALEFEEKKSE